MKIENLAVFLYILQRDEIPSGVVERIIRDHVAKAQEAGGASYSAPHLGMNALDQARRIMGAT